MRGGPLLVIDAARQAKEVARAREMEEMARAWRWSWLSVYAQCVGLGVLGYVIYGMSFGARNDEAQLLVATSMVVAYVLPFLRLLFFFLRNADQF